ncbi:MAG: hypothetical protein QW154_06115 [Sulfolobales archaeon]
MGGEVAEGRRSRIGVETLTTKQAVIVAFNVLGVRKVAVAAPYIEEINVEEKTFLESGGFVVVKIRDSG